MNIRSTRSWWESSWWWRGRPHTAAFWHSSVLWATSCPGGPQQQPSEGVAPLAIWTWSSQWGTSGRRSQPAGRLASRWAGCTRSELFWWNQEWCTSQRTSAMKRGSGWVARSVSDGCLWSIKDLTDEGRLAYVTVVNEVGHLQSC